MALAQTSLETIDPTESGTDGALLQDFLGYSDALRQDPLLVKRQVRRDSSFLLMDPKHELPHHTNRI